MSDCAATGVTTTSRPESARAEALLAPLRRLLGEGGPVAVAYSGGLDSSALIHATAGVARQAEVIVHGLHVHHGLSPHADTWLEHAQVHCAALGIPFHSARVQLDARHRDGLEAQARQRRYEALARMAASAGCKRILLAHHQDDQAETLLLQALRGAGIRGLAGMPSALDRAGLTWSRPWLGVPRAMLQMYVLQHGLAYVEDESNADVRHARNRLRHQVLPLLSTAFPGAAEALAQVAANAQEALTCLDELAALDLARIHEQDGMGIVAWLALSPARRGNVLRAWLRQVLGRPAPRTLAQRLLSQLQPGLPPRQWPAPGGAVALYRDVLRWVPQQSLAFDVSPGAWQIDGPGVYAVSTGGGGLSVTPVDRAGVPLASLQRLSWRRRHGGEQFQQATGGVPRSLKKAFQARGVPAWERDRPLLYAGEQLLFVPGLGLDARHIVAQGEGLMDLHWQEVGVSGGSLCETAKI